MGLRPSWGCGQLGEKPSEASAPRGPPGLSPGRLRLGRCTGARGHSASAGAFGRRCPLPGRGCSGATVRHSPSPDNSPLAEKEGGRPSAGDWRGPGAGNQA